MASGDYGKSWRQVPSPTALGHITLVHQAPGLGVVLVVETWDDVIVYRGSVDDGAWTEIGKINISGRFSAGAFSRPFAAAHDNDVLIGMPDGALTYLDAETGTARALEATGTCASFAADGAMYALGPAARQKPLRRSRDHATTWEQVTVVNVATACPVFLDSSAGYLVRIDGEMKMSRTSDGGSSWVDLSPLPVPGFTPYLGVVDEQTVFAVYTGGAVYGSRDRGSTWARER